MMETTQRGKKKVNKRNNVDKFNENIGLVKNMKDKMKSDKATPLQGVEGVKSEPNLDVEFKKEPVLNAPMCENEPKNSNICSKPGDGKNMKPGLMESVNVAKIQDRPFIDPKTEMGSRPEDGLEEEDLQSNLLSSKIKAENIPPDGSMFAPDSNENLILGLCNQNPNAPANQGPGIEQTGSGIQPLPSNVINKQPGTMEAQYMQQQSQIFVFTTALANKSAESVLQGQYPSIIAYHCAQPGTKKYLEKHPLKLNQFNRQSPAQWLNNLAQIKQKTVFGGNAHMKTMGQMPMGPRGPMPGNMPGPCEMAPGPGSGPGPGPGPGSGPRPMAPNMQPPMTEIENMNEQSEIPPPNREMGDHRHGDFPGGVNPMNSMNMWNQGNMNQNNMGYSGPMKGVDREKPCIMNRPPMVDNMNPNHFPGVSQLTLTGTKVPTENLTPQQRQHRAEQLATLRKMQEMLFPENQTQHTDEFGNPRMVPGGNVTANPEDANRNNALDANDMKNQIAMKNVNNSTINNNNSNNSSNNTSNNNNGNNNNSNSNNSGSSNNNNNSSSNNNSNSNSNSPMNRLMGRNMNGQSNRNMPMDNPMNHNVVNPPNNVLDTPENIDPVQDQNSHVMQKMPGGNTFPSVAAQLEWQKHYQQFQEEQKKKKGSRTDSPVSRSCSKMQGPPPPYHQTARSASVPIAVPSPNPGSPSNTTSNLSLPSPRTSSDLNSPSDVNKHASTPGSGVKMSSPPNNQGSPSCSKLMSNNPETPVSSASQSPTPSSRKESSQPGLEFPSKDLFSRTVPSLSQQKHPKQQQNASANKEPNLMPVPSPQQIHYLNTFEGQELTIQKQPNTSLKESNMNSPISHTPLSETPKCKTPNGAANSPLSQVPETSPRFPSIATSTSTTCTTPVSTQSQPSIPTSKDTTTVPSSPDTAGPSPCRSENLPLNPNGINCPSNNKSMHFDPITSLAQMSQQLTSQTTPPCPGAGPMMSYNSSSMHMVGNMNHMEQHVGPVGPGGPMGPMGHENPPMENMQFAPNNPIISCAGPMMDMSPGFLNTSSPKQNMGNPPGPRCVAPFFGGPGFQKMMGPNTYNGMNVQVKASTPNTIQYLPARPNTNSPNPNTRGPPSLDFLQRFTNPMNNMDSKVSFIPNCHSNSMDGVNPGPNPGMNCGGPVGSTSGNNLMSNSVSNMLLGGNMVLNPGPVGPLRGQLRPGPGGMMKVPQMGGGGGTGGGPVFPPGPGCDPMVLGPGGNPGGMFIQGSKSSPLGMPPDASQPLPPSMSQGNNFKNSPFVGPTVADPNYAQQFHNFQQQLYATNTRSHQMNSHMNQSYFLPK